MPGTGAIGGADLQERDYEKDYGGPFFSGPSTKLGWRAVKLLGAAVVMFAISSASYLNLPGAEWFRQVVLPFWGIVMFGFGVAGGIVGLTAITRKQERSWLVWVTVLPMVAVAVVVLGQLVSPQ